MKQLDVGVIDNNEEALKLNDDACDCEPCDNACSSPNCEGAKPLTEKELESVYGGLVGFEYDEQGQAIIYTGMFRWDDELYHDHSKEDHKNGDCDCPSSVLKD